MSPMVRTPSFLTQSKVLRSQVHVAESSPPERKFPGLSVTTGID